MAVVTANTSIALTAGALKKNAVVAVGAPTVSATGMAIWAGASVDTDLAQSIIGTFAVLIRYLKDNLASIPATGPTVIHTVLGKGIGGVTVDGIPTASECRLYIGADLITKERSHDIEQIWKRLREAWLERKT